MFDLQAIMGIIKHCRPQDGICLSHSFTASHILRLKQTVDVNLQPPLEAMAVIKTTKISLLNLKPHVI